MKRHAPAASYVLDDTDRDIIAALKQDGRMPFAEIARRLHVSPGMVRQRYLQLVEDGVLLVVPVTDPILLGYEMMAVIGIRADVGLLREITRQIAAFEEVIYLVVCTGAYDMLVEVVCRDNSHLLNFLTERLGVIQGIRASETFVYLEIVKELYI
jgi:Lrp/AsnC family transcriptional regulator, regulator for asnA, asnC and gidA